MSQPKLVAIVNDFEVIVLGLAEMLDPYRERIRVVELDVGLNPARRIDIALFDTYGHCRNGLDRVRALADDSRIGSVAVYTWAMSEQQIDDALGAGARGVIAKSTAVGALADALLAIDSGELVVSPVFRGPSSPNWPGSDLALTKRESDVAAFLAQGFSNRDIVDALFISEHTVKSHLKAIFQKTGVSSRAAGGRPHRGELQLPPDEPLGVKRAARRRSTDRRPPPPTRRARPQPPWIRAAVIAGVLAREVGLAPGGPAPGSDLRPHPGASPPSNE